MATITATVSTLTSPPSVSVVCAGGVGAVMRVQGGVSTPVRGTESPAWVGTVLDYCCQQQTPASYTFAGASSALVEMPEVGEWMFPVGRPELGMALRITKHDGWETPGSQSVARIPGRAYPVVVAWGARSAEAGTFEVTTDTRADEVALKAVLANQDVVFLSTHANYGLAGYLSIGDVSWARQIATSRDEARKVTLQYVAVDRPVTVAVEAGHRWADEVGKWSAQVGTWSQQ